MKRVGILILLAALVGLAVGCGTETGNETPLAPDTATMEKAFVPPVIVGDESLEDLAPVFWDAAEAIDWKPIELVYDPANPPVSGVLFETGLPTGEVGFVLHVLDPSVVTKVTTFTVWVPNSYMTHQDMLAVNLPFTAALIRTRADGDLGDVTLYVPFDKYYDTSAIEEDVLSFKLVKVLNETMVSDVFDITYDSYCTFEIPGVGDVDTGETRGIYDPPGDVVPPGDE